jgi:hypothetical protein
LIVSSGVTTGNVNAQYCLTALYLVAVLQGRFGNTTTVYKGAVSRSQIAQTTMRRGYFQQTVMTGEKLVFRQVKVRVDGPANQKSVSLREAEDAAFIRPSEHS